MLGIDAIVAGAVSALVVSVIGWRWASPARVHGFSGNKSWPVAGVPGGHSDAGRGLPGRVPGPGGRVRGPGTEGGLAHSSAPLFCNAGAVPPPAERGVAFLPATKHVTEFIAWAIVDEDGQAHRVRFRNKQLVANYRTWAQRLGVYPLPELSFLTMMAKHPQVTRSRERVKDRATGRVVRLPTGSPKRQTVYTVFPLRAEPKMPGKVPTADIVPKRDIGPPRVRRAPSLPVRPMKEVA